MLNVLTNRLWGLGLAVVIFGAVLFPVGAGALSLDVMTNLNGDPVSNRFGIAYIPMDNGMTWDLGFGVTFPKSGMSASGLIGVGSIPYFGGVDADMVVNLGPEGIRFNSLVVSKTWLYKLTEDVNIGFRTDVLTLDFSTNGTHKILSNLYPVISARLDVL